MNTRNLLITLGLVVLFALIVMPKPLYYEQPVITGVVVDAETKQPVDGAAVVARWVVTGGFYKAFSIGVLDVQRTVTDDDGKFILPGWDRRWRPWLSGTYLDYRQPYITVVKAEYEPERFSNDYSEDMDAKAKRVIQKNRPGEQYEIKRLAGSMEEKYRKFKTADGSAYLGVIPDPLHCGDFEEYKPALLEVDKWEYQAEKLGFTGFWSGSWLNVKQYVKPEEVDQQCTGVIAWLKEQRIERKAFYEDI